MNLVFFNMISILKDIFDQILIHMFCYRFGNHDFCHYKFISNVHTEWANILEILGEVIIFQGKSWLRKDPSIF